MSLGAVIKALAIPGAEAIKARLISTKLLKSFNSVLLACLAAVAVAAALQRVASPVRFWALSSAAFFWSGV
jgi:hypothetical protein